MTREEKYRAQLQAMGIYQPAFEPEIHTLSMMEREHQRTLSAWKRDGSDPTSELYPVIVQQRRDILAHRDALGVTPKALRRLKAAVVPEDSGPVDSQGGSPAVSALLATLRSQAAAAVSDSDHAHE